ncbi:MAG TPA: hypothetical protein VJN93_03910 [Candidatus Acidoferrum sp.]|nr:hypothetical protein [Candidatus Acidoferrum sp.]
MPSLNSSDRTSLCRFSFADGRRCRSLRVSSSPDFCHYHSQKEARSRAARKLSEDLAYFFSGDYLSANDLSAALGRILPAVISGELKPRTARTVAYLMQTLQQTIRLSQHEYINAFSTDGWRSAIRSSVRANHNHLYPPPPAPDPSPAVSVPSSVPQPQTSPVTPPSSPNSNLSPHPSGPSTVAPPPVPPTSLHCTSISSAPPIAASAAEDRALAIARSLFPPRPTSQPPAANFPAPSRQAPSPSTPPISSPAPASTSTPAASPATPLPPPAAPQPPATRRSGAPTMEGNRDPYAIHFDETCRLRIDGKLV